MNDKLKADCLLPLASFPTQAYTETDEIKILNEKVLMNRIKIAEIKSERQ